MTFDPTKNRVPYILLWPDEKDILFAWPHGYQRYVGDKQWEDLDDLWDVDTNNRATTVRGKPAPLKGGMDVPARRHNSTAVHHPNTLDGRRVAAPVTLSKAPWERIDMKEEDIKKLEELAKRLYEQKQEDKEIDDDGFITIYESSRGSTVKEDAPKD
jgi:hypothetical protein